MRLTEQDVQVQLSRRRPGQSKLSTPRDEKDQVEIHSGTEFGTTLGTPIMMLVRNQDQRPKDYSADDTAQYPRPSHADWTYLQKYGVKASSGGGRSSARETIGRVAAGAIAEKYLKEAYGIEIVAFVSSVGKVSVPSVVPAANPDDEDDVDSPISPAYLQLLADMTREQVDASIVRCPHAETAEKMIARIERAKENHDSIGGTVTCVIRNCPVGLGEPCFDKMEASLAHAMLSIPSTKAFEIGSGFAGAEVAGSKHNDAFGMKDDGKGGQRLGTLTNNSGGIQGGITNGEHIFFRIGFKPPATIGRAQQTSNYDGAAGELMAKGRHDPCVVNRAVPIVESMAALVVMDQLMIQLSRQSARSTLPVLKTTVSASETVVGGEDAAEKQQAHGL
ncbi:chorismate synthase [Protomyces lactucae-debilis]|uniref:chorismate synthase n=1 Tax=Protomyces lactucae-debilis TaxID=2754530 RepID=A0A1Y2F3S0_PROLT|nr:chorismate synthase [Protomyces lactucae-debilis]ORY78512.1 chorismate synthase [Protomyces lactucae-debilis]